MKINTRVIGLGCVGLPMVKLLAGKLSSYVFDINKNRNNILDPFRYFS